jgi:hypothetical protein
MMTEKPEIQLVPEAGRADAPGDGQFVWEFVCPQGWGIIGRWGDGFTLREKGGGLRVLVDCSFKDDGAPWLHVSYSRKPTQPTAPGVTTVSKEKS